MNVFLDIQNAKLQNLTLYSVHHVPQTILVSQWYIIYTVCVQVSTCIYRSCRQYMYSTNLSSLVSKRSTLSGRLVSWGVSTQKMLG